MKLYEVRVSKEVAALKAGGLGGSNLNLIRRLTSEPTYWLDPPEEVTSDERFKVREVPPEELPELTSRQKGFPFMAAPTNSNRLKALLATVRAPDVLLAMLDDMGNEALEVLYLAMRGKPAKKATKTQGAEIRQDLRVMITASEILAEDREE